MLNQKFNERLISASMNQGEEVNVFVVDNRFLNQMDESAKRVGNIYKLPYLSKTIIQKCHVTDTRHFKDRNI